MSVGLVKACARRIKSILFIEKSNALNNIKTEWETYILEYTIFIFDTITEAVKRTYNNEQALGACVFACVGWYVQRS